MIIRYNPKLAVLAFAGLVSILSPSIPAEPGPARPAGGEPAAIAPLLTKTDGATEARVRVAFDGECEKLVVDTIRGARTDIRLAIFTFTSKPITKALVQAAKRHVRIAVKYDESSYDDWKDMRDAIGRLRKAGIDCISIDPANEYARMHHKFAVIDGARVITGSFNFTKTAANANFENVVLIESDKIAALYLKEFDGIADDAE